jgi:hypothetical protein
MTEAQQEDLFTEWELYDDQARKGMITEYQELQKGQCYEETF